MNKDVKKKGRRR